MNHSHFLLLKQDGTPFAVLKKDGNDLEGRFLSACEDEYAADVIGILSENVNFDELDKDWQSMSAKTEINISIDNEYNETIIVKPTWEY